MSELARRETPQVRLVKTAEVVATALRRRIVRGEIPEGGALPSETALMEEFGVSRPSLREALRVLESENLITVRRGAHGGARACRPNVSVAASYLGLLMQMEGVTLAEVYTARIAIEPSAVRLLAASAQRGEAVQELRGLLAEERNAVDDAQAYTAATIQFHQRLVEVSGNKAMALLWGTLQEVLAGEVLDSSQGTPPTAKRVKKRQEVITKALDLIEAGDGDAAGELWRLEMVKAGKGVLSKHGAKTVVDVLG